MDLNKSPPQSSNDDSVSSPSTPQSPHEDSADLSLINDNEDSLTHSPWHSPRAPWNSPPPSPANIQDPPHHLVQDNNPPPHHLVQDNNPPMPPPPPQQQLQDPYPQQLPPLPPLPAAAQQQENLQDIIEEVAAEVDTDSSSGPDSSVASRDSSSSGRNVSPPPHSPSDAESAKRSNMTKSSLLLASIATAFTVSVSSQSRVSLQEGVTQRGNNGSSVASKKFVPRYDGMRFIETLITAHR
ncbi:unnamed protein product [Trifolium pratense]|uniref:Uncharacterized protein n=1 Tax=Trifolium pratense TaxID=57577 RepID=A0ACB0JSP6_TRIPR|nr:unnamed protein product [Trifolium pratense]